MAVDGPGVRSVIESIKLAKQKNLAIVDGFVWRWTQANRDAMRAAMGQALVEFAAGAADAGQRTSLVERLSYVCGDLDDLKTYGAMSKYDVEKILDRS